MSNNPINLTLHFLLELAGLAALGYWGWTTHAGLARYAWTLLLPLAAAAVWGIFRVDGDPNRAPVPVSGPIRLLIELAYFAASAGLLALAAASTAALVLAVLVITDYALAYDRVLRMLRNQKPIAPIWPGTQRG